MGILKYALKPREKYSLRLEVSGQGVNVFLLVGS